MRVLLCLAILLLLLPLASPAATAAPGSPLEDHDDDGDMETAGVCVWGFSSGCALRAYECFQPYRPGFGIACP